MMKGFKKISGANGFDRSNPDNGRQNNYAWSMAELGDYIYVGTGRNFVYSVIKSGVLGDIEPPSEFTPRNIDMAGEIWRYGKDGRTPWELVYKSPQSLGIVGFRFMIRFTTSRGETGLYAGAASNTDRIVILKYTEENGWRELETGITTGNSTRSMVVYNNTLYMSVMREGTGLNDGEGLIYESRDPEKDGWQLATGYGEVGKNPSGPVIIMEVFNGHVYAGVASAKGFEVWRSNGNTLRNDHWKLVIDRGAGDELNEIPLSMGVFRNHLYIGTAIYFGIMSIDSNRGIVSPKAFDIIRIDKNDGWELVVGGKPRIPVTPITGDRNEPISNLPSGFGNIANGYCWQIQEYNNELYIGTWDWSVLFPPLYRELRGNTSILDIIDNAILKYILGNPRLVLLLIILLYPFFGFDLYKSNDGVHFVPISINGFNNPGNYGVRKLFYSEDGRLYIGTANPFEGCEVWRIKSE